MLSGGEEGIRSAAAVRRQIAVPHVRRAIGSASSMRERTDSSVRRGPHRGTRDRRIPRGAASRMRAIGFLRRCRGQLRRSSARRRRKDVSAFHALWRRSIRRRLRIGNLPAKRRVEPGRSQCPRPAWHGVHVHDRPAAAFSRALRRISAPGSPARSLGSPSQARVNLDVGTAYRSVMVGLRIHGDCHAVAIEYQDAPCRRAVRASCR